MRASVRCILFFRSPIMPVFVVFAPYRLEKPRQALIRERYVSVDIRLFYLAKLAILKANNRTIFCELSLQSRL